MAKKNSSKKAVSKVKKGAYQKKVSPSDRGSIDEEFTVVSDTDIQNVLSNSTLQSAVSVPTAGTSGHAMSQAESSQSSSSEMVNTTGVQGDKPTVAPPGATEAKQNPNHSTQSQAEEKETPQTVHTEEVSKELLNALIAIKLQSNIQSGLENRLKELSESIKGAIDADISAFNLQGKPTVRPSAEQIEKEFHLDQLRVLCLKYKEASEKSIAEIYRRNQEVIWKFEKWRSERVLEVEKFEEMGRNLVLGD